VALQLCVRRWRSIPVRAAVRLGAGWSCGRRSGGEPERTARPPIILMVGRRPGCRRLLSRGPCRPWAGSRTRGGVSGWPRAPIFLAGGGSMSEGLVRAKWERLAKFAPGIATMLSYRRGNLPHDVTAGLSVAAVAIPVGVAYAELAGFEPVVGLYASI